MKFVFLVIFYLLLLSSCQSVSKKINEKISEEETQLSKWLEKKEDELKVKFGDPDRVELKEGSKNKYYVYTKEKLKIKCERIFEINPKNRVVGFTSKNCF